jgi:hypothetical protein
VHKWLIKADDFVIDRLCLPVVQLASTNSGSGHIRLAQEALRVGIVTVVVGLFTQAYETGGPAWQALAAMLWIYFYRRDTKHMRELGDSEAAAALVRIMLRPMRCALMVLAGVLWGFSIFARITDSTAAYGSLMVNVGAVIYWLHEWFRACGTPPPKPKQKESFKLADQPG